MASLECGARSCFLFSTLIGDKKPGSDAQHSISNNGGVDTMVQVIMVINPDPVNWNNLALDQLNILMLKQLNDLPVNGGLRWR
jgi:hypothetical protein